MTSRHEWPTWHPSEVTHSQHPEVITVEEVQAMDFEITHDKYPEYGIHHIIDISKYKDLTKLLSVSAYILRLIHNCKNPAARQVGHITPNERNKANLQWIFNT